MAVDETYAGFVAREPVYVMRTLLVPPAEVEGFVARFTDSIPARRSIAPSLVPVGAWRTVYGRTNELLHVYEFGSLEAMESDLALFLASDGGTGTGVERAHAASARVMRALPYCPVPIERAGSSGGASKSDSPPVNMFVVVYCTRSGMGDYIAHFGSGIEHRRELSPHLVPVGAWRALYGTRYYEVNHMYSFPNLAEMERARRILYEDEPFRARISINTSPLPPNFWEWGGVSTLMTPLPYSRMP